MPETDQSLGTESASCGPVTGCGGLGVDATQCWEFLLSPMVRSESCLKPDLSVLFLLISLKTTSSGLSVAQQSIRKEAFANLFLQQDLKAMVGRGGGAVG